MAASHVIWRVFKAPQVQCYVKTNLNNMSVALYFAFASTVLFSTSYGDVELLGKGRWLVLTMMNCEDADQYDIILTSSRTKINRTHDSFNLHMDLDRELNSSYGVELVIYKEMDGGFKFHQTMGSDNFCDFVKEYTGENWSKLLSMAGVDPPDCPIPTGEFKITEFVVDYQQLEETGLYGTFDVTVFLLHEAHRIICTRWLVRFEKEHDDDDDDDDDDE